MPESAIMDESEEDMENSGPLRKKIKTTKKETTLERSSSPDPDALFESSQGVISHPKKTDIILGRGKQCQLHEGNQMMLEIIDRHHKRYTTAKRETRRSIANDVLDEIMEGGARFLKKSSGDGDGHWEEVERVIALDKVSHALRCKTRKYLREGEQQQEEEAKSAKKAPSSGTASDISSMERPGDSLGALNRAHSQMAHPPLSNTYPASMPQLSVERSHGFLPPAFLGASGHLTTLPLPGMANPFLVNSQNMNSSSSSITRPGPVNPSDAMFNNGDMLLGGLERGLGGLGMSTQQGSQSLLYQNPAILHGDTMAFARGLHSMNPLANSQTLSSQVYDHGPFSRGAGALAAAPIAQSLPHENPLLIQHLIMEEIRRRDNRQK